MSEGELVVRAIIESIKESTEEKLAEFEELPPVAFVFLPERELHMVDLGRIQKRHWPDALRAICERMDASGIVIVSEAWMVEYQGEDAEEKHRQLESGQVALRDSEDKVEVVHITWEVERKRGNCIAPILGQHPNRKLGKWREFEETVEGDIQGKLTRLLKGARGN